MQDTVYTVHVDSSVCVHGKYMYVVRSAGIVQFNDVQCKWGYNWFVYKIHVTLHGDSSYTVYYKYMYGFYWIVLSVYSAL